MKSYIACALLLLVQLASADEVININNGTDQALEFINKLITHKGLGVIPLPPLVYDDIQMFKGYLAGVGSLKRTGPATATINENSTEVTVDFHIGRRLYDLVFGLIKLNGDEMTGVFRVKNNSVRINYTLFNQTRCYVKLNKYEYETLTDVSFESSLAQYGGDVSDVFEETVLPRINEKFAEKKQMVEIILTRQICRRPHHFNDATHLSEILSESFVHF